MYPSVHQFLQTDLSSNISSGTMNGGSKTAEALAKHCQGLVKLNLNCGTASPMSIAHVLLSCKKFAVLKVAGIQQWVHTLSYPTKTILTIV